MKIKEKKNLCFIYFPYSESQGSPTLFDTNDFHCIKTFFNTSSFVFHRIKKVLQVWNDT